MPLEIKELVIKATVRKELEIDRDHTLKAQEVASLKKQILIECRSLIKDMMRNQFRR